MAQHLDEEERAVRDQSTRTHPGKSDNMDDSGKYRVRSDLHYTADMIEI